MDSARYIESPFLFEEKAEHGKLSELLAELGGYLDDYLRFEHPDALSNARVWRAALGGGVPEKGIGAHGVMQDMGHHLIPNGSQIPKPGCTAFITTGATSIGAVAALASTVASPQRGTLTAFHYLEEVSLNWMAEMFELPAEVKGVYSSGGSTANLVALGGARQQAFENAGLDPSRDGVTRPCRIYASKACHHTIQRSAAVLGMGRDSVVLIDLDARGRMCPMALEKKLKKDLEEGFLQIAIVANCGATDTGAIDPLRAIGDIAKTYGVWFHVDGAYGLPGILDPLIRSQFDGLELIDSVIVDAHKWLGAPIGIGATFVKDRSILQRAFTQGAANYFEGAFAYGDAEHSMDSFGVPYSDFGVELSAPPRGATVWALIKEIGIEGLRDRVCRHNWMARQVADFAAAHENLEVALEPTLSICCFRYITDQVADLDELNRRIHRRLVRNGENIPSTTKVDGKVVIRPCFVGARTNIRHAEALIDEVISVGDQLTQEMSAT